ncbi:hypothetical protein [uncultured Victivallis sp.]|uniref:hypothetical protein n=1 Tax=uncultured Victivallis sp. TaxID=354118 RepID=UPI00258A3311|nr:hypothetical protein [uncultured Victivallis sp.]
MIKLLSDGHSTKQKDVHKNFSIYTRFIFNILCDNFPLMSSLFARNIEKFFNFCGGRVPKSGAALQLRRDRGDSKTGSASGAEGEPVCPAGHIGRENQQKPFKPVCERFVRWNRFRREIVEGERRLQKPFPGGHARRARL